MVVGLGSWAAARLRRSHLGTTSASAPDDCDFMEYNTDESKIRQLLQEQGASAKRIAHKQNRTIVFDPAYFHEADACSFRSAMKIDASI